MEQFVLCPGKRCEAPQTQLCPSSSLKSKIACRRACEYQYSVSSIANSFAMGSVSIPALSSVDHPLSYPKPLERQRKYFSPDHVNTAPSKPNGVVVGDYSPLVIQRTHQDKTLYIYERQRIVDLCNMYAYTLDSTMMDLKVAEDWANLFTDDCVVTYPFGKHDGREGLAKFGMVAESRFKRMLVSCLRPSRVMWYAELHVTAYCNQFHRRFRVRRYCSRSIHLLCDTWKERA